MACAVQDSELENIMDIKGYFPAEPVEFKSVGKGDRYVARMNRLGMFFLWTLVITVIIFPLHPIRGNSMNPTYINGQETICTRLCFGGFSQGDVVITRANNILLIKRVAACPGDTIKISPDGNVTVNDKPYTYGMGSAFVSGFYEGLTLNEDGSYSATMGDNQYYLLGDNHENSADSRYYGPFTRSAITEKVLVVI